MGFHRALLEHADAAVLVIDPDDLRIRWASTAARRLLGAASGSLPELVAAVDSVAVGTFLQAAAGKATSCRFSCAVPVDGSTARRVDLVARDLSLDPDVRGLVVVAMDVTGWAELVDELSDRLNTDALTGLANRVSLYPRMEQAVRDAPENGRGPVLLFVDLDYFKSVNDRYGHAVGDEVLRVVASRLHTVVSGRGTAVRFGGDEFVVLLDRTTEREAVRTAREVQAVVGAPLAVVGDTVAPTMSVGVRLIRRGDRPQTLLRDADVAMYRAKTRGPGGVVVYTEDLRHWALARQQELDKLAERLEQLRAENRALAEAASIDKRTGLANAATFDSDHARHNNTSRRYCLLLIDIDRFHDYNTRYRYLAGHEALRQVGQTIRHAVRPADRTYRYGGEEFTVLLPELGLADAVAVGERVRQAVVELGIPHEGSPEGVVTVSVGAVEVGDAATVTDAVEAASVAVLEAKDAGRNRVIGTVASSAAANN